RLAPSRPGPAPNVVVIILEGWTGKFVRPIGEGRVAGRVVTPHFNRLAGQGLLFTRFYASGGRTTNGLIAMIGGIPDRPGLTAVRTRQILNRFSGLGSVLKDQLGYRTLFIAGNDLSFNNKRTIMSHWGYEKLIGKAAIAAMPKEKGFRLGAWGYDDGDLYQI